MAVLLNFVYGAEAPDYLLELMSDKNTAISKLCLRTLDIIAVSIIILCSTMAAICTNFSL